MWYALRYGVLLGIFYFIAIRLPIIGDVWKDIRNLYALLLFVPTDYLLIKWGIYNPLNQEKNITKKELRPSFTIISSLFVIVCWTRLGALIYIVFAMFLFHLLFCLFIKSKKENEQKRSQKEIKRYFSSHPNQKM